MNHGKLEVVNKEMARVNIHILGISELKRTGMSKFNSDHHISTAADMARSWTAVSIKARFLTRKYCNSLPFRDEQLILPGYNRIVE